MDNKTVTIKLADNGVVVTTCGSNFDGPESGPHKDETFVYKNLKEAFKNIPGMFSVLKDGEDDDSKRTASGKQANEKYDAMIEGD